MSRLVNFPLEEIKGVHEGARAYTGKAAALLYEDRQDVILIAKNEDVLLEVFEQLCEGHEFNFAAVREVAMLRREDVFFEYKAESLNDS